MQLLYKAHTYSDTEQQSRDLNFDSVRDKRKEGNKKEKEGSQTGISRNPKFLENVLLDIAIFTATITAQIRHKNPQKSKGDQGGQRPHDSRAVTPGGH
jgi:hypothetical protein